MINLIKVQIIYLIKKIIKHSIYRLISNINYYSHKKYYGTFLYYVLMEPSCTMCL
jgi:hypothetical protein